MEDSENSLDYLTVCEVKVFWASCFFFNVHVNLTQLLRFIYYTAFFGVGSSKEAFTI